MCTAQVALVRPDRKGEKRRFGSLGRVRQWIESIFDALKGQLSREEYGGRTPAGVMARVAQRLLAMTATLREWSPLPLSGVRPWGLTETCLPAPARRSCRGRRCGRRPRGRA